MQANIENDVMTVTFTIDELYSRLVRYISETGYEVNYLCAFIGAWGLAKIRKKAIANYTDDMFMDKLIQYVERGDSANLCLKLITGSGCSQKYAASYRSYIRMSDGQFKVINNVVTNLGEPFAGGHTCVDIIPGWKSSNYQSAKNFNQRVADLGEQISPDSNMGRDTRFRLGILKMNIDNGNGDQVITMRYQCDEDNYYLRAE